MRRRVRLHLDLPVWLYRVLRPVKRAMARLGRRRPGGQWGPDLSGDRDVEWSWVAAEMPAGPGKALDFGSGESSLGLVAAHRGFEVTGVDLQVAEKHYVHPRLRLVKGDILELPLAERCFDLVINCSTVEHVGVAGRYGVTESDPDGDLKAMARLRQLMKRKGTMLLTVPAGQDAVFPPACRVYGEKRLPPLLGGYAVQKEAFWIKDEHNRWTPCDRKVALGFKPFVRSLSPFESAYALGCFVLRTGD